ncbi:MAG: hypothetical protein EP332_11075 [Bacteroidetes bacterium]|nr:MAG: hypothetical protein EP332_11075 [Bacteroidota bacterium]
MKRVFLAVLFLALNAGLYANDSCRLNLTIGYSGTLEGHDYLTVYEVFVNSVSKGTTVAKYQTEAVKVSLIVPKGHHSITVKPYAQVNGVWSERTALNGFFEKSSLTFLNITEDFDYFIVYDIQNNTILKSTKLNMDSLSIYSTALPRTYAFAEQVITEDEIQQKCYDLNTYLEKNSSMVMQVTGSSIKIGTKGSYDPYNAFLSYFDDTLCVIKNFKSVTLRTKTGCYFTRPKHGSNKEITFEVRGDGNVDELYQKLRSFFGDVVAYDWTNKNNLDNTPQNVERFDLQKKIDKVNKHIKANYSSEYLGISLRSDSLIFDKPNGTYYACHFFDLDEVYADKINKYVEFTCKAKIYFYHSSGTRSTYSVKFPNKSENTNQQMMEYFTRFYNSFSNYAAKQQQNR